MIFGEIDDHGRSFLGERCPVWSDLERIRDLKVLILNTESRDDAFEEAVNSLVLRELRRFKSEIFII